MTDAFVQGSALVIGIARYQRFGPLPASVRRDAEDLAALLLDPQACGYPAGSVALLVDEGATANSVRAELVRAAARTSVDATFVLFFSGHGDRLDDGTRRSFLVPHDFDPADTKATRLDAEEILQLLDAIPAKRQVVLLDACHSGGIGHLKGPRSLSAPKGFGIDGLDMLGSGAGRVVLASSRSDESSVAFDDMRNSVFTSVLLDALRGAGAERLDGAIGVLDAFEHVASNVPKLANQHPVLKADNLEGNFAIARRPVAASSDEPQGLRRPATAEATLASLYPLGPMQDHLWSRAGGDPSRLQLAGTGVAQWHAAIRAVAQGGGGLGLKELLGAAAADYPGNTELQELSRRP